MICVGFTCSVKYFTQIINNIALTEKGCHWLGDSDTRHHCQWHDTPTSVGILLPTALLPALLFSLLLPTLLLSPLPTLLLSLLLPTLFHY